MKRKWVIVNFCLMITVLFAMLLQSIHSYEHVISQLTEKQCHKKHVEIG
jgi:putative component of membrane protein insertase Oxa1/YidC/SpoIIIJ protein YidD